MTFGNDAIHGETPSLNLAAGDSGYRKRESDGEEERQSSVYLGDLADEVAYRRGVVRVGRLVSSPTRREELDCSAR